MRILLAIAAAFFSSVITFETAFAASGDAVVRLSSKSTGVCATGFFVDGGSTIVTNVHVTQSLCPAGICEDLQIEKVDGGKLVRVGGSPLTLRVARAFPAIDVAEIAMPPDFKAEFALHFSSMAPKSGEPTTMIGFPSCGVQRESKGSVSHGNSLSFGTEATGASGSSGSPILNSDGEVFGIAFEADSLLRAIYDKMFGGSFNLRAIRADTLIALLNAETPPSRLAESKLLLDFYERDLRSSAGMDRIFKGIFFLNRVKSLAKIVTFESDDPGMLRAAASIDNFPGVILQVASNTQDSPDAAAFTRLVFASNLESRGPFVELGEPLTKDVLERALTEKNMPRPEIDQFLALLPDQKTAVLPGLLPFALVTSVMLMALLTGLVLIYGGTLGYVYAKARGGIIRRILIMFAVAICLWPVSFIVWLIRKKSR